MMEGVNTWGERNITIRPIYLFWESQTVKSFDFVTGNDRIYGKSSETATLTWQRSIILTEVSLGNCSKKLRVNVALMKPMIIVLLPRACWFSSFPSQIHINILNMLPYEPSSSVWQAQAGLMKTRGSGCPTQRHCMTPFLFFFSSPLKFDSQIWASEEMFRHVSMAEMLKLWREWLMVCRWSLSLFYFEVYGFKSIQISFFGTKTFSG